jgi:valacyclovir hydrolase
MAGLNVVEQGSGDVVLVLPGFTLNIDGLKTLRDHLAARYHVIAVDLPGSGKSGPQPRDYTASFYHDDADAMATVLKTRGVSSARIFGHSDGGEVALVIAARHPALVRSLVTEGTLGDTPPAAAIDLLGNVIDAPVPDFVDYSRWLVNYYGRDVVLATTKSWAKAMHAIAAAGGSISRDIAGSIGCPALLMAGANDPFVTPNGLQAFAKRLSSAEVIVIPNAGHSVHSEKRELFNATVADWFAAH